MKTRTSAEVTTYSTECGSRSVQLLLLFRLNGFALEKGGKNHFRFVLLTKKISMWIEGSHGSITPPSSTTQNEFWSPKTNWRHWSQWRPCNNATRNVYFYLKPHCQVLLMSRTVLNYYKFAVILIIKTRKENIVVIRLDKHYNSPTSTINNSLFSFPKNLRRTPALYLLAANRLLHKTTS